MKRTVYYPNDAWGHKGDSFREIIKLWHRDGFVDVLESPDRYVWMDDHGEILLYDYDLVTDFGGLPEFKIGLFGNQVPQDIDNAYPWILWARNPHLLEQAVLTMKKVLPRYRMWKSMFVGKVENETQFKNRFQTKIDWTKHIQNFAVVKGAQTPYPYTPQDYLYNMSITKFAFLLPGYGPKCNRDIEATALGAIPVVTPGVATDYWNEWEEGVNFLRMETEDDIEGIYNTSDDILESIQQNNYEWYKKNCSSKGSFDTTLEIVKESGYVRS